MSFQSKEADRTNQPAQVAAWRNTISRMPLTLRPVLNQKAAEWEMLFPFERANITEFFRAADSYDPGELNELMAHLREIESKMGVVNWSFSEESESLEYASQIARSLYYGEWRQEVQRVYSAIEARAATSTPARPLQRRLVLLILPMSLPFEREMISENWWNRASEFKISGDSGRLLPMLMGCEEESPGIPDLLARQPESDPSDIWFIDAGDQLPDSQMLTRQSLFLMLNFAALKPFCQVFLAKLNTIPRDLAAADQVVESLRKTNWTRWCSPELNSDPRLRQFVIDLFLSGNGALIFPGAFAEWAASEAIRRARPRAIIVRFGLRSKPKPFTSIAIFENQDKVSVLPDVADMQNSAIDSLMLSNYVRLSATRYPEYEESLCLCIAEHLNSGWMQMSDDALNSRKKEISVEGLARFLSSWLMDRT